MEAINGWMYQPSANYANSFVLNRFFAVAAGSQTGRNNGSGNPRRTSTVAIVAADWLPIRVLSHIRHCFSRSRERRNKVLEFQNRLGL